MFLREQPLIYAGEMNCGPDPEYQKVYEEEAARRSLWLQLVQARLAAGLTQKQMTERLGVSQAQAARIEKEDYDAYTLTTLRK